jgi:hypothetical protein
MMSEHGSRAAPYGTARLIVFKNVPLSPEQIESVRTSSRWNFQTSTSKKKRQTCIPSPPLLSDSPYNKYIFQISCAWIDALVNLDGEAPGFLTAIVNASLFTNIPTAHTAGLAPARRNTRMKGSTRRLHKLAQ